MRENTLYIIKNSKYAFAVITPNVIKLMTSDGLTEITSKTLQMYKKIGLIQKTDDIFTINHKKPYAKYDLTEYGLSCLKETKNPTKEQLTQLFVNSHITKFKSQTAEQQNTPIKRK